MTDRPFADDVEHIHPLDRLYCDYCETEGHTFRSCPRRDDEPDYDEEGWP